jgi:hypothetical protein
MTDYYSKYPTAHVPQTFNVGADGYKIPGRVNYFRSDDRSSRRDKMSISYPKNINTWAGFSSMGAPLSAAQFQSQQARFPELAQFAQLATSSAPNAKMPRVVFTVEPEEPGKMNDAVNAVLNNRIPPINGGAADMQQLMNIVAVQQAMFAEQNAPMDPVVQGMPAASNLFATPPQSPVRGENVYRGD